MQEILISSIDAERIQNCIEKARLGGYKASVNLVPLINELNRARKVKPDEMPRDVVTMNSVVSLLNHINKQVVKIQIVYPQDADIAKHKVSIFAPVGTALIGYRKGDKVQWNTPSGSIELEILDILNELD